MSIDEACRFILKELAKNISHLVIINKVNKKHTANDYFKNVALEVLITSPRLKYETTDEEDKDSYHAIAFMLPEDVMKNTEELEGLCKNMLQYCSMYTLPLKEEEAHTECHYVSLEGIYFTRYESWKLVTRED